MGWDMGMYAISSDNDNKDNNYTKPSSSITVTYHLNNQALKKKKGGEEREYPVLGFSARYISRSQSRLAALKAMFITIQGY